MIIHSASTAELILKNDLRQFILGLWSGSIILKIWPWMRCHSSWMEVHQIVTTKFYPCLSFLYMVHFRLNTWRTYTRRVRQGVIVGNALISLFYLARSEVQMDSNGIQKLEEVSNTCHIMIGEMILTKSSFVRNLCHWPCIRKILCGKCTVGPLCPLPAICHTPSDILWYFIKP